jgi:predicted Zn-dependent protease
MKRFFGIVLCLSLVGVLGWPDLDIKKLGKDIAGSTGVVSGSQIDAVVEAGSKLQEASNTLTPEQEDYLGRGVSALIMRKYPLYRGSPELTHYLNIVGNTLAARSSQPEIFSGYHFAILDTAEVNALSAPGGFIFISRGFLKLIADEEALAGVLAHEIAHVVKRHGVNAISQAHLTEAVLILGKEAASSYGPSELNALANAFGESANQIFDTLIKNGCRFKI